MTDFETALEALRRGDFATAGDTAQAILRTTPNDFRALMLLADVQGATGRLGDELTTLTRAVAAEPRNAPAITHLGQRLLSAGRLDAALARFAEALTMAPTLEAAIAGTAAVHEARGRYDLARRIVDDAIDREAPGPGLASVAMRIYAHDGEDDKAIALGELVALGGHRETIVLRQVLFLLARAYERSGRHADAFRAAARANEMLRLPFDRARATRQVDDMIACFDAARRDALPRSRRATERPVFIVGMPRSGSTLVERILHAHPRAFGVGEIDLMLRALGMIAQAAGTEPYPACLAATSPDQLDEAADGYLAGLARVAPESAERVSNKHLGNWLHVGPIARILPGARFVVCRRDPVNVCFACWMERLAPAQAPWASTFEDCAFMLREQERLLAFWAEAAGAPMLDFSYEELVDDAPGRSRALIDFLGLEWDDACLRPHEVERADATISFDQVRKPIYRESLDRAAGYGDLLDPLRAALA